MRFATRLTYYEWRTVNRHTPAATITLDGEFVAADGDLDLVYDLMMFLATEGCYSGIVRTGTGQDVIVQRTVQGGKTIWRVWQYDVLFQPARLRLPPVTASDLEELATHCEDEAERCTVLARDAEARGEKTRAGALYDAAIDFHVSAQGYWSEYYALSTAAEVF